MAQKRETPADDINKKAITIRSGKRRKILKLVTTVENETGSSQRKVGFRSGEVGNRKGEGGC